jgi:hypothetical protein
MSRLLGSRNIRCRSRTRRTSEPNGFLGPPVVSEGWKRVETRDQYLRWPSEAHAKRLGAPTALADASPDQSALELGEPAQDGEWPAAIIVAATCVRHNGHRGRSSALLLG